MAAPPITIGPFDNVPAPGSAIRSPWAQEITQYLWDNTRRRGCGLVCTDVEAPPNALAPFTWDAEVWDSDAFHVPATANATVPAGLDGMYVLTVTVATAGAVSSPASLIVNVKGVEFAAVMNAGQKSAVLTLLTDMAAGQGVSAGVYNSQAGPWNFTAGLTMARQSLFS